MNRTELSLDAAGKAISFIPPDDRDMWIKIGMALKDEYGENARDTWFDWSGGAKDYNEQSATHVWKSIKASGNVTIGSLIYEAKQFGWRPDRSDQRKVTPEEYARKQAERERRRAADDEANKRKAERSAARAAELWATATPIEDHPYLERKGIKPHGARLLPVWERKHTDEDTGEITTVSVLNVLLVPIYSGPKTICSIQAIFPARNDVLGRDKDYLPGGAKQGGYYTIGAITKSTLRVIFGEGFATCASIFEATGTPVIVCFDAGNLGTVAATVREKLPDVEIIIAGDNDLWTKGNPGARKANAAAFEVHGRVSLPIFTDYEGNPTDFNDLKDPDEIRLQIEAAINPVDPDIYVPDCRWEPEHNTEREPVPQSEVGDAADTQHENTDSPSLADSLQQGDGTVPQKTPPESSAPTDSGGAHEIDEKWNNGNFRILGYDHDRYFIFQHEKKQLTVYSAGSFTDSGFIALAPLQWWEMEFPAKSGFEKRTALNWFIRAAHERGIFDPSHTRGRGAWVDRGRIVLHMGNKLVVDGETTEITEFKSRYVYELDRTLPALSKDVMTTEEGEEILATAMMFRWTKPASAPMIAGWCALAPLCGALRWRPHVWLTGGAGCGKSLSNESSILTPTGWTTIGSLSVGDVVSTPDNSFASVRGVYPQGVLPVYRVTFADGRSVRASGDHLWKVRIKDSWRIRTTDDMIEILSRETRQSRSLAIQLCEPMDIKGNNKVELPLHPYVLGAILGDGGVSQRTINFTSADEEIIERVRSLCPEGVGIVKRTPMSKIEFRFCGLDKVGRSMRSVIKELKLLGSLSEKKFIPRAYLEATIEDRIELLKGLMDTDGYANDGGSISYCTVSDCLKDGVVELVQSLGGVASVSGRLPTYTHNGEKLSGKPAFMINIRFKDPTIAFSLQRKLERVRADHQYSECLYLNVKSIDPDGESECTCIQVDHPDRLFITNEFIVTHNTTALNDFVHPLMNGMDIFAQGNSTEAGIRQTLRQDALPVLFDESEKNNERERMRIDGVLALIRQASTESAARTLKGTAFGDAQHFYIRSMFCLASIQVGMEHQADFERLAVLALRPKRDDYSGETTAKWETLKERLYQMKRDEGLPARLFRRSLDLLPITLQNIDVFSTAAAKKFGSQRDGDQYGTLMAGAWSLISDKVATLEEARLMLDSYDWGEYMEHADTDDSTKALSAIMGAHIRMQGGATLSVYELLLLSQLYEVPGASKDLAGPPAEAMLGRYGIKICEGEIVFANTCVALHELVSNTPFASDLKGLLLRIKGARRYPKPIWVNGITSRGVSIPIEPLLPAVDKSIPVVDNESRPF